MAAHPIPAEKRVVKKAPESKWLKAKALFEKGTSLREIEKQTGIHYKTIDNRAKKHQWVKGSLARLISDSVRVKEEFATLNLAQQDIVSKEVDSRTKHMQFFTDASMKNVAIMMEKVNETTSIHEHRSAQATLKDGKETVLGKAPDTAIMINNSQNVYSVPEYQNALREVLNEI